MDNQASAPSADALEENCSCEYFDTAVSFDPTQAVRPRLPDTAQETRRSAEVKIIDVDGIRISGLNWKLHILVQIAVINEARFIQTIPWSGTFHHARSLVG